MFKALVQEIKKTLRNNIKFIITFFLLLFIVTFEFPFYIDKTGGIIDISDRIIMNDNYKLNGSINMAYVSEIKATIPSLIIAKIDKNWDIISKTRVNGNQTDKEAEFSSKMDLNESINNAIIVAYNKADKNIDIELKGLYVTYIYEEANTDLKVGDKIINIDGKTFKSKKEITDYIKSLKENVIVNIKVINNNKTYNRKAKLINIDEETLIGIIVSEDNDINIEPKININFNASESGPSGGLMMSLAIYSKLVKEDITKNRIIVGTGTIDKYGNVGSIGGVKYKLAGAVKNNADIFIVPNGDNYKDAIKYKKENNYDIIIVGVSTFDEAINYLKS